VIVFNLTCGNDHGFEGWFASADDFARQQQSSLLSCPVCGSNQISKAPHAPRVSSGSAEAPARGRSDKRDTQQYANVRAELMQMIEHVIATTEDVGPAFPEEARRIHYKEVPERKIRGNASRDEVRELREEGIEVVALPVPGHLLGKTH